MVLEGERAAVRFGDLPAEHETNARTRGFGREERYEQVGIVGQAGSLIVDPQLERAPSALPADRDAAAGFQRCVDRVVEQIDQELLQLIGIGSNRHFGTGLDRDPEPRLHAGDAAHERGHIDAVDARGGQLRQARVGGGEPTEGVGTRGDHGEAAPHVVGPVVGQIRPRDDRLEASGNRLDGRERVVDLVADDADETLPRLALFVAQRTTDVG